MFDIIQAVKDGMKLTEQQTMGEVFLVILNNNTVAQFHYSEKLCKFYSFLSCHLTGHQLVLQDCVDFVEFVAAVFCYSYPSLGCQLWQHAFAFSFDA